MPPNPKSNGQSQKSAELSLQTPTQGTPCSEMLCLVPAQFVKEVTGLVFLKQTL